MLKVNQQFLNMVINTVGLIIHNYASIFVKAYVIRKFYLCIIYGLSLCKHQQCLEAEYRDVQ